jgi:ubiquitin thioesterase OTU1
LINAHATKMCAVCGHNAPAIAAPAATTDDVVCGTGPMRGYVAVRRAIPSDNSCLFNAVAYLCTGKRGAAREPSYRDQSPAQELREVVASFVLSQPETFNAGILGKPPSEYVPWILDLKRWGGSIEMHVLAAHFNTQIVAIDIQTLIPHVHGRQNPHNQRQCFLLYSGVHYDAIAFTTPDAAARTGKAALDTEAADLTVVEASDESNALEMALDLARRLRRSGQFTDLTNCNVQCLDCFEKFRGREECVNHAQETGHQNFGEFRA